MDIRYTDNDAAAQSNDLQELTLLAKSAGATLTDTVVGVLKRPSAKYFVGEGKAEEIAAAVARVKQNEETDDVIAIFNHALSPSQERNLEKILQCRVLDRTGLILDIFASRAKTHEGKLQVELAQLSHLATRLVRGWTHLERQKGGIGLRGPGETQLETDRRLLQIRVKQLKAKLAKVKQTRAIGRSKRQKSDTPTIALVGYTNAGKSTLFNRLTGDNIYAADRLFATLDPTLRRVHWQGLGDAVIVDTVGFIQNLPHELVESFHATLEETVRADLLLHVVDNSSANAQEHIDAVNAVLKEIGADKDALLVCNKIDQTDDEPKIVYAAKNTPDRVYLSAATGEGIDRLTQAVGELLQGTLEAFELRLDAKTAAQSGAFLAQAHACGVLQSLRYDENGQATLRLLTSDNTLRRLLGKHRLEGAAVLSADQAARLYKKENWESQPK